MGLPNRQGGQQSEIRSRTSEKRRIIEMNIDVSHDISIQLTSTRPSIYIATQHPILAISATDCDLRGLILLVNDTQKDSHIRIGTISGRMHFKEGQKGYVPPEAVSGFGYRHKLRKV
jgi:hypothetical protein